MSEFNERTSSERHQESDEEWFSTVCWAYIELIKSQSKDIIWPQRTLATVVKSLGWEITLKYRESKESRIINASLMYSLDKKLLAKFLSFLWDDNLPRAWMCLVCLPSWVDSDILITEKNEEYWKRLVDTQWPDEEILFVSRNYPNWYKKSCNL